MPEDEFAFQMHQFPNGAFMDSSWDLEVSHCVFDAYGHGCGCILPQNVVLDLRLENQEEWFQWIRHPEAAESTFPLADGITDYKKSYPIPGEWFLTVHIRYFSSDFTDEEIAINREAIRRILDSVEIRGGLSPTHEEHCVEEVQSDHEWLALLEEDEGKGILGHRDEIGPNRFVARERPKSTSDSPLHQANEESGLEQGPRACWRRGRPGSTRTATGLPSHWLCFMGIPRSSRFW